MLGGSVGRLAGWFKGVFNQGLSLSMPRSSFEADWMSFAVRCQSLFHMQWRSRTSSIVGGGVALRSTAYIVLPENRNPGSHIFFVSLQSTRCQYFGGQARFEGQATGVHDPIAV